MILNFKAKLQGPVEPVGLMLDILVAHDPSMPNGLSAQASATLSLAKAALISQMKQDIKAGCLDERRIAQLMGEGPGAAVIGQLVLGTVLGPLGATITK